MTSNNLVPDLFDKILSISLSDSQIPEATRDDPIYQHFSSPPILSEDDKDEGMWYIINKSMDAVFGVNKCEENL
jgi:hypothetical protein